MSASTDPIWQLTCNLAEFQGPLPIYGMPYLFRCTGLILAYKVALMDSPLKVTLFNQDDSFDTIIFFED